MPQIFDDKGVPIGEATPEQIEAIKGAAPAPAPAPEQAPAPAKPTEPEPTDPAPAPAPAEPSQTDKKIEELQNQLKEANEKIGSLSEGDKNWKEMREKIDNLTKEIEEAKSSAASDAIVAVAVSKMAGSDQELEKKIRYHIDRFGGTAGKTAEQINEIVRDAYLLSTSTSRPDPLAAGASGSGAGGGSPLQPNGSPVGGSGMPPLTEGQLDLARRFNLTDEDIAKYDTPPNPNESPVI